MIEILPVGVAIDHGAAEFQLAHAAFEFVRRGLGVLHRQMREAGITIGPFLDLPRQEIIGHMCIADGGRAVALGLYAGPGDGEYRARDAGGVHRGQPGLAEVSEPRQRPLAPFWERAEILGALIYLHPADPVVPAPVLEGHKGLRRATWEWTFETGSHALRLIFAGVFDRFPRARLALGHLGETLPFLLWRFDSRAGPDFYAIKLAKRPSQYFKDNFVVTTSGMCSPEPLACTIATLGHERIMFAADYPFESAEEAGHFIDGVKLDERVRADICFNNAERLLGLAKAGIVS